MTHGLLAPTEFLTPTPVIMSEAACLVNDPHGIVEAGGRYIYALFHDITVPATERGFWRYDIWTDAWQSLAAPAGNPGLDAGTCMYFDCSRGGIWLFLVVGGLGNLRFYNCSTDAWVVPAGFTGPIVWGGVSGALFHPCVRDTPLVDDEEIYLIGGGAVTLYHYTTAGGLVVVPVGMARGGVPGPGTTLNWIQPNVATPGASYNQYNLLSIRGDGTAIVDVLTINKTLGVIDIAVWGAATPLPGIETFTTGTCAVQDPIPNAVRGFPGIAVLRDSTMRLRELYLGDAGYAFTPLGTFPGTDGVAHVGQAIVTVRSEDGTIWFYFAKHSQNAFMRIQKMM